MKWDIFSGSLKKDSLKERLAKYDFDHVRYPPEPSWHGNVLNH